MQVSMCRNEVPHDLENKREPGDQPGIAGGRCLQESRGRQGKEQDSDSHDKSGNWTCNPDVEERCSRSDRGADADKRAHSPEYERHRKEEWKSRINAVALRVNEVSHFVCEQDGEQGNAERNSQNETRRVLQRPAEGKQIGVGAKLRLTQRKVVFEAGSYQQSGKDRGGK